MVPSSYLKILRNWLAIKLRDWVLDHQVLKELEAKNLQDLIKNVNFQEDFCLKILQNPMVEHVIVNDGDSSSRPSTHRYPGEVDYFLIMSRTLL